MRPLIEAFVVALAVAFNVVMAAWHLRRLRRLRATYADAADAAQLAYLQARTLGECRDLLCEDCRSIVAGHYAAAASPAYAEFQGRHPR